MPKVKYWETLKESYREGAQEWFEDFLIFTEWNRPIEQKFYLPRRKALKRVVDQLQRLANDEIDILCVSMAPGVGKALANDTPILTRNGWKKHGDLKVGDEVIGMDGQFKPVIRVLPKCQLDRLVEFTNGEKILCHARHEWLVSNACGTKFSLHETQDIEQAPLERGGEKGHRGHRYNRQLPFRSYIAGDTKTLAVPPYTMGAWLGDGSNERPRISNDKKDEAVIQGIVEDGYEIKHVYVHKTTGVIGTDFERLRFDLHAYGFCYDGRRIPKRVPEDYLTASVEQRLELLAGLLDTDGTLVDGKKYQFTTAEETLRDSFCELVSTFGWRYSVAEKKPCVSSSGIVGKHTHWVIGFCPDCYIPCRLERKQIKGEFAMRRKIAIKSITKVEPQEGNCITVEGGMYLAGKTMLPTHNTGLGVMFTVWLAGRNPLEGILTASHNKSFLEDVYNEVLRELDADGEYLWHEAFPERQVVRTNAKNLKIDIDKAQRFSTFQFTSTDSGNAGKLRALQLLYCDDLITGIEEAVSKDRLDKKWQLYTTDLRQRKYGDHCKELHIATRWSVHDVIGRIQTEYEGDPRVVSITLPVWDENEESLFPYAYSTKTLHDIQRTMDEASWRALYLNEPIEREGLLFPADELRYFFDLPDREPDAIVGVCDTKDKGTDYCFMPVAYQYGEDFYIADCVCSNALPEVVEPMLVDKLLKHKVHMARFESNSAGGRVARDVQQAVKERGGRCKITTKYSVTNKETRIIVNSAFAKEHFLFRSENWDENYKNMMKMLTGYVIMGRNKNDDVPDGMAMLADFVQNMGGTVIKVVNRPF